MRERKRESGEWLAWPINIKAGPSAEEGVLLTLPGHRTVTSKDEHHGGVRDEVERWGGVGGHREEPVREDVRVSCLLYGC